MPANAVTTTGLTIQTLPEIISEIENGTTGYPGMYQIYGPNINVDPNSPDGQMINIIAQAKLDMLEYVQQVFTSFDPDQAVGVVLDQRCAINGVFREAGTYTFTPVSVVISNPTSITLPGLDTNPTSPFTVADAAGNQYYLVTSYSAGSGTYSLQFRAANLGPVTPIVNTITIISTVTLGVVSVNNPTLGATTIGTNEESDYALRIRRSRSVALGSQGWIAGLYSALYAIPGVTSALILENVTSSTDGDGIPGHSIWVLVDGGNETMIGEAIYNKRNAGCGMKGSQTVTITQVDGTTFVVLFDRPTPENLWVSFNTTAITGTTPPDDAFIRSQLLAAFQGTYSGAIPVSSDLLQQLNYKIGQPAATAPIVSFINTISPNTSVSAEGVSDTNGSYVNLKTTAAKSNLWLPAAARIKINGVLG
jgi:uncharacterized phage protein gp47/JayE